MRLNPPQEGSGTAQFRVFSSQASSFTHASWGCGGILRKISGRFRESWHAALHHSDSGKLMNPLPPASPSWSRGEGGAPLILKGASKNDAFSM
jgi:hypothetical protein